jgi:hypothetical protein
MTVIVVVFVTDGAPRRIPARSRRSTRCRGTSRLAVSPDATRIVVVSASSAGTPADAATTTPSTGPSSVAALSTKPVVAFAATRSPGERANVGSRPRTMELMDPERSGQRLSQRGPLVVGFGPIGRSVSVPRLVHDSSISDSRAGASGRRSNTSTWSPDALRPTCGVRRTAPTGSRLASR